MNFLSKLARLKSCICDLNAADEEGKLYEILLNEVTAMNTTNPVFVIIADIETEETIPNNIIIESKNTKSATSSSVKKIIDEYPLASES